MLEQSTDSEIWRINKLIDIPSPIQTMYLSNSKKFLAVGRQDNSIEVWKTDSWIQIIKIAGNKSK